VGCQKFKKYIKEINSMYKEKELAKDKLIHQGGPGYISCKQP